MARRPGPAGYLSITKIFSFEMAHVLYNHRGLCKNIHGHTYHLHVSLTGKVKNDPGTSDDGMLMDFSELKELVKKQILDQYDHALVINSRAPYTEELERMPFHRVEAVPFQPTSENLVLEFARLLVPALPQRVKLHHLRLYETGSSYADWWAL